MVVWSVEEDKKGHSWEIVGKQSAQGRHGSSPDSNGQVRKHGHLKPMDQSKEDEESIIHEKS